MGRERKERGGRFYILVIAVRAAQSIYKTSNPVLCLLDNFLSIMCED